MPKKATKYYDIKIENIEGKKGRKWIKIGSATSMDGEHGPIIMATVDSIPLHILQNPKEWTGEFMLVEATYRNSRIKEDQIEETKEE